MSTLIVAGLYIALLSLIGFMTCFALREDDDNEF